MDKNLYDIVIIGSGIVGGAIAYKLSQKKDLKIAVIDKEQMPNMHQSGRNSGVIHSGIYYPKNSLKSKNCLEGYRQLLSFLKEFEIEYKITGKLIVASQESEYTELDRLYNNGINLGLNVKYMDKHEIHKIDKNLVPKKGFFVEQTGITDYKKVLEKFIELSSSSGVKFMFSHGIKSVSNEKDLIIINTEKKSLKTKYLINCAGLQCDRVFKICTGKNSPVTILPFKGEYFNIEPRSYNSDIPVYPVPNANFPFLGIHLTRMIDGSLNVGPNAVLSFDREGYNGFKLKINDTYKIITNKALFNVVLKYGKVVLSELMKFSNKAYFEKSVKKYFSNFSKKNIIGYSCGIRAQATENGQLLSDFRIEKIDNQIHVLNAPSPAATSCLAIADTIIEKIEF